MTQGTHAPPVHPADAIAADGSAIVLADGRTVSLRYTMGSLRLLEARFGSLQGLQQEMDRTANGKPCPVHAVAELDPASQLRVRKPGHGQAAPDCPDCQPMGAMFTSLSDAIAPGLLHEYALHPDTGTRVRLGKDPELVAELLLPGELQTYMNAWAVAFNQAMANLGGQGNGAGPAAAQSFPGPSGTTPGPSSSDAPMPSSGA